ncbi:retrovirus-related Pol polyprotein from transposon [Pseudoscourfieldia marina]
MEKLKEDGTLLHPAHIFYPELARTKVSKSACVFNIGTKIGPGGWASYLQTTVALSTVESEVMALTEAIKEAIYIRRLLESQAAQEGPTIIYTDSTGAEALVDHPTSHRRTKHIEIRREFIKFHIGHETVKIERVSTKDQLADIMTKPHEARHPQLPRANDSARLNGLQ